MIFGSFLSLFERERVRVLEIKEEKKEKKKKRRKRSLVKIVVDFCRGWSLSRYVSFSCGLILSPTHTKSIPWFEKRLEIVIEVLKLLVVADVVGGVVELLFVVRRDLVVYLLWYLVYVEGITMLRVMTLFSWSTIELQKFWAVDPYLRDWPTDRRSIDGPYWSTVDWDRSWVLGHRSTGPIYGP